jgi:hypothetical protein
MGIPLGLFMFYKYYLTTSLTINDTKSIVGIVKSFHFKENKWSSNEYFITTKNHTAKFEIEDNFLFNKKKELFEKSIHQGDTLIMVIPKKIEENQDVIPIYEIKSKNLTFFSFEDYAKRIESSKTFYFWSGLVSLLIGFSRLIYSAQKGK